VTLRDAPWEMNWAWGIPLIVFTVVFHVCSMGLIHQRANRLSGKGTAGRRPLLNLFRLTAVALAATVLLGIEACTWTLAYVSLGALSSWREAMLYSLSAMTSYGHVEEFLPRAWQLMGALEALNGMMLFGLTTAFLFAIIQRSWPLDAPHAKRPG